MIIFEDQIFFFLIPPNICILLTLKINLCSSGGNEKKNWNIKLDSKECGLSTLTCGAVQGGGGRKRNTDEAKEMKTEGSNLDC